MMSLKHETRRRSFAYLNESITQDTSTLDVKKIPFSNTIDEESKDNNSNHFTTIHTCCFQLFSVDTNISDADNNNEKVTCKSKLAHLYSWLQEKLDDEIFTTQKTLFLFFMDWVLDFGTAIGHFSNGDWIEGTLTYLIVLFAGTVATCGFLKYKDMEHLQKDTRAAGLWLFILLHIPSWFLFVCLNRKLYWLRKKQNCDRNNVYIIDRNNKEEDETACKEHIDERVDRYSDLTLKATWWDTVLEAKPQALLQTIFLIEISYTDFSTRDYIMPLLLSLWTIHSITKNIYAIVLAAAIEDKTPTFSKLYGYTYTVLSNMAPAMCINTARNQYETDTDKFLITVATIVTYYVFLVIVERTTFFTSSLGKIVYGKVFHTFMGLVFTFCLCQWVIFGDKQLKPLSLNLTALVVIVSYVISFVVNIVCFWNAMEFAEVSFKLKNDMVQKQSRELKMKIKSFLS